jgi:hypothetical protein
VSGDFPGEETSQFNPKFGVTWNPLAATTVRAAIFRTLKRTLITDQTLEPTQVAGFNQFFDDINLTETWRYGGLSIRNSHGTYSEAWKLPGGI